MNMQLLLEKMSIFSFFWQHWATPMKIYIYWSLEKEKQWIVFIRLIVYKATKQLRTISFSSMHLVAAIQLRLYLIKERWGFLTVLEKHIDLHDPIQIFKKENAFADEVADAGERFLLALYGSKNEENMSLDKYRYQFFLKSLTKSKFNLASLPPTSAATRQHSLRTYHQVQWWYGFSKKAEEWGWKKAQTGITPVTTLKDPAPKTLLTFISCKCKTRCGKACGCRKAGLKCSVICSFCNGKSCENVGQDILEASDEDEDLDLPLDTIISNGEIGESGELEESEVDSETETTTNTVESTRNINEPGPSGLSKRKGV